MKLPVELQYLDKLIRKRVQEESKHETEAALPRMPAYDKWELPLGTFVEDNALTPDEACVLLIGLAHTVHPDLFQEAIEGSLKKAGEFPGIGGVNGKNFRGILPTGDTALFILAGGDWKRRLEVQHLFSADHIFARKKILWLEEVPQGEPAMSGKIIIAQEYIELFTQGKAAPPHFGISFPAKRITTELGWDHLVVNKELTKQIDDLLDWRTYHDSLRQKGAVEGRFRNGYRALFHGPPGTGKTFTASLLGKTMKKDVYRIDLSMVVSKYIGETEKNLELLFARAEDKDWILFFDEADAIFSKRTNIKEAHDKYANQEVSYLLQRIEDYNGLVILASNMRNNIDEAFIRRFNSIMHFPMPDAEERKLIWQKTFLPETRFRLKLPEGGAAGSGAAAGRGGAAGGPGAAGGGDVSAAVIIEQIKHYQLSGGSILNVVHYASIKGVKRMGKRGEADAGVKEQGEVDPNPKKKKAAPKKAASIKAASKKAVPAASNATAEPPLTIYLPDIIEGIRLEFGKDNIPFK